MYDICLILSHFHTLTSSTSTITDEMWCNIRGCGLPPECTTPLSKTDGIGRRVMTKPSSHQVTQTGNMERSSIM
jgi:hypothetical protein